MAESGNSKQFKLKVANFGPIAEADIDLRPMTVFVGPSNTGKSYLAMLIYALHQFFSQSPGRYFRPGLWSRWEDNDVGMSEDAINALIEWMKEDPPGDTVPNSIAALVRGRLQDVHSFGDDLNDKLARCFGIEDTRDLIRHRSDKGANVDMEWRVSGHPEPFIYKFTLNRKNAEFRASVPDTIPLSIDLSDRDRVGNTDFLPVVRSCGEFIKRSALLRIGTLSDKAGSYIVRPLSRSAYYLPADRTGVMYTHQLVLESLYARVAIPQSPTGTVFSGVLSNFAEQLIYLSDRPYFREYREFSDRLEREMLHGEIISKDSAIDYPEFYYRPEGQDREIPLMNSSSMVSELAPVVLYLRHFVESGDVLIIEEPESHLHPEMQVEFVRHLAAAVNAGIRVMLTTHSEWVLEELANLIRLSELPKSRRKDFVDTNSALTEDQLGVWLFETKKSPKGTVVREIQLDLEIGNFPSGYDDVAMATYNRWAEISNLIGERKS